MIASWLRAVLVAVWRWFAPSDARGRTVPRPETVQTRPLSPATVDHWRGEHGGAPNLDRWPPSTVERFWAGQVLCHPDDVDRCRSLRHVAGTAMRAAALVRWARRVDEANEAREQEAGA